MLIVITRTLIILGFLLVGLRYMGKRTIGELQPYEFVITLAIADIACVPMQDVTVPIIYGLIPLCILFVTHYVLTMITSKSIRFRKFLNGKPIIVIDGDGINYEALTALNLNVNDLMSLVRQQGYFSLTQISYGILETNGKLSILENEQGESPSSIPMSLVIEGKILTENLDSLNIKSEEVLKVIEENHLKLKDVVLITADSNKLLIQPKKGKYFTVEVA